MMSARHSSVTQSLNDPDAAAQAPALARAADDFIAEFKRWREVCGLSQKKLAGEMGYDPSYISKIESGHQQPTRDFAHRADVVMQAGGALMRRWREYSTARARADQNSSPRTREASLDLGATVSQSLVVSHEEAELRYVDGAYHARMRRQLHNASDAPVTRFLIRIAVDRHPGKAEQSNELYRQQPLTWDELNLAASCGGEEMSWQVKHDRDAFKELWLLFENEHGKFPLYPGESTWIEYSYTVSDEKWGQWFQRAVRLPTERLSVRIWLPAALQPALWGVETTMTSDAVPVPNAISQRDVDGQRVFEWGIENPPLHARYRFEWRFRAEGPANEQAVRPSERMRKLGVVQRGDPILEAPARPFELPAEADIARGLGELLLAFVPLIRSAHSFGKGVGLAAPQIGVARAAAVVQAPDNEPRVLYNPTIIATSEDSDEQYEGCLSFFDVRGLVPRPLRIEVEHTSLDGARHVLSFDRGAARLWAHEIDHLQGILYIARMRPGTEPIEVERYRGSGSDWHY